MTDWLHPGHPDYPYSEVLPEDDVTIDKGSQTHVSTKAGQALTTEAGRRLASMRPYGAGDMSGIAAAIEQEVRDDIRARVEDAGRRLPDNAGKMQTLAEVLAAIPRHESATEAPCDIEPARSRPEGYVVDYCHAHDQPADQCSASRHESATEDGERPGLDPYLTRYVTATHDDPRSALTNGALPAMRYAARRLRALGDYPTARDIDKDADKIDAILAATPTPDDRDREVERIAARELLTRLESDHKAWADVAVAFTRAIGGEPHDAGLRFFTAVAHLLDDAGLRASGGTAE